MGPHEPYWRTNSSFSPPPTRWDYQFRSDGIQYGSNESIRLFGSTSSNSKESRIWMRGDYHQSHMSAAETSGLYYSSPSDTSLVHPWTPPPTRGVNIDDFETSAKQGATSGPLCFTPMMEASTVRDGGGSTSSRSDGGEFEHTGKLHLSTPRNYPSRRSFMSKPIHPLSFPVQAPTPENSASPGAGVLEYDAISSQRYTHRLSSGSSSIDLADISEPFESYCPGKLTNQREPLKCELCDRLLSQRSPWSSRRIVRSGDLPITGVLSCHHVFHAECLEQTTPKSHRSDPLCPICTKVPTDKSPEQRLFPRSFPRLKAFSEEGSSKTRDFMQAGDCAEGGLQGPHRSGMLFLNRNRVKKNKSAKGNSGIDLAGKLKKTGPNPLNIFGGRFIDYGAVGCSSKTAADPSMKM